MTTSKRDFLNQLADLELAHSNDLRNPGSYRCAGCTRCSDCMFCDSCSSCYKCTHCAHSDRCTHCTHCTHCTDLHSCAYCVHSQRCTNAQYLTHCRDCSECTFCFGCVGLRGKEFHILNQPYDRKTFFAKVAALKKTLGLR